MLLKPLSWWSSPLHLTSTALLSVLGEGSLTCGSLWGFYVIFTLFKVFLVFFLTLVEGRWYHTRLKPYETNCDLWIWAIQIKFDWLIEGYTLISDIVFLLTRKAELSCLWLKKVTKVRLSVPIPRSFSFLRPHFSRKATTACAIDLASPPSNSTSPRNVETIGCLVS